MIVTQVLTPEALGATLSISAGRRHSPAAMAIVQYFERMNWMRYSYLKASIGSSEAAFQAG